MRQKVTYEIGNTLLPSFVWFHLSTIKSTYGNTSGIATGASRLPCFLENVQELLVHPQILLQQPRKRLAPPHFARLQLPLMTLVAQDLAAAEARPVKHGYRGLDELGRVAAVVYKLNAFHQNA